MINFIVYEKHDSFNNRFNMAILNFLGGREEKFKILKYNEKDIENSSRNVYILNSEDTLELYNISNKIRKCGDWTSQIILISNFKNIDKNFYNNELLILDYLEDADELGNNLKKALHSAYNILNYDATLNFSLNGEVYRIPYSDILYIEKENNQNYCMIHTENENFLIKDTINNLEKILDSAVFMKTHRSCIINIFKVKHYNCFSNTISFNNINIDMITRDKRQILKLRLIDEKIK